MSNTIKIISWCPECGTLTEHNSEQMGLWERVTCLICHFVRTYKVL